ncbi:MAG: SDR family oxidoreductase [Candidatus Dormibacteraeota bacterium]|nr:SDR family oxidoreductase [Candidatus Dormibacteraeota bacterium]
MAQVLDRFRLDGRVAVVTGASAGLGVAFAHALSEAGATVALAARRLDRLRDLQRTLGSAERQALAVQVDVSDPDQCSKAVSDAMAAFGRVDILINSAGVGTAVAALRETPDEFRKVIETNLNGSYWMAQACARVMQPGSAILNISSVLGITTAALPQAAYSSSKAAIIGLTRDLAQQWTSRRGIRVNALAPGFFPSEMTEQFRPGYLDSQMPRVLMGREGDPAELAAAAVFLVSDASSYITGQTLVVDGGFSIT